MKKAPAWWTAADQAELDVAIWTILDGPAEARGPCWDLLEVWLTGRRLLSKAQWLRRLEVGSRLA